jgi:hypothetical protein
MTAIRNPNHCTVLQFQACCWQQVPATYNRKGNTCRERLSTKDRNNFQSLRGANYLPSRLVLLTKDPLLDEHEHERSTGSAPKAVTLRRTLTNEHPVSPSMRRTICSSATEKQHSIKIYYTAHLALSSNPPLHFDVNLFFLASLLTHF